MQAEELIEMADQIACKMFSDAGGLGESRVWIHTKGRLISIPCKPNPALEPKMKALICAMIYAARKAGTFEGVVMMAEAWMSTTELSRPRSSVRPALDPNRKEIIILLAYGQDGKSKTRTRKIESWGGNRAIGPILEDFNKPGLVHESWLDAAFEDPTEEGNNGKQRAGR